MLGLWGLSSRHNEKDQDGLVCGTAIKGVGSVMPSSTMACRLSSPTIMEYLRCLIQVSHFGLWLFVTCQHTMSVSIVSKTMACSISRSYIVLKSACAYYERLGFGSCDKWLTLLVETVSENVIKKCSLHLARLNARDSSSFLGANMDSTIIYVLNLEA